MPPRKLPPDQCRLLVSMAAAGEAPKRLSSRFGIKLGAVYRIINAGLPARRRRKAIAVADKVDIEPPSKVVVLDIRGEIALLASKGYSRQGIAALLRCRYRLVEEVLG